MLKACLRHDRVRGTRPMQHPPHPSRLRTCSGRSIAGADRAATEVSHGPRKSKARSPLRHAEGMLRMTGRGRRAHVCHTKRHGLRREQVNRTAVDLVRGSNHQNTSRLVGCCAPVGIVGIAARWVLGTLGTRPRASMPEDDTMGEMRRCVLGKTDFPPLWGHAFPAALKTTTL